MINKVEVMFFFNSLHLRINFGMEDNHVSEGTKGNNFILFWVSFKRNFARSSVT